MSASIRHVNVRGRVQGVGYRVWAEDEALRRRLARLGAQPPRRHRRGGFAGPAELVAAMVEACRRGAFGSARPGGR